MSPINPLSLNPLSINPLSLVLERVRAWPVQSQQGARRNALIANTAMAARRAEREDVNAFFASRAPRRQLPVAAHR
jgi:hypothetical protein